MRTIGWISLAACAALASTGAIAAPDNRKNDDPNRVICEKQEVPGSRLATRKVCMTAAEWKLQRAADRQAIDKAQMQAQAPSGH